MVGSQLFRTASSSSSHSSFLVELSTRHNKTTSLCTAALSAFSAQETRHTGRTYTVRPLDDTVKRVSARAIIIVRTINTTVSRYKSTQFFVRAVYARVQAPPANDRERPHVHIHTSFYRSAPKNLQAWYTQGSVALSIHESPPTPTCLLDLHSTVKLPPRTPVILISLIWSPNTPKCTSSTLQGWKHENTRTLSIYIST